MIRKANKGFTLIELMVVIIIVGLLMALLLPAISKIICASKSGAFATVLHNITEAAAAYEQDNNLYPPSNESHDTSPLVDALKCKGSKKGAYVNFKEGELDERNNIIDLVVPTETVKYRKNKGDTSAENDASAHNKGGIDLWCKGCTQDDDEINNWDH